MFLSLSWTPINADSRPGSCVYCYLPNVACDTPSHADWSVWHPLTRWLERVTPSHTLTGACDTLSHADWSVWHPLTRWLEHVTPSHTLTGSYDTPSHADWVVWHPLTRWLGRVTPAHTLLGACDILLHADFSTWFSICFTLTPAFIHFQTLYHFATQQMKPPQSVSDGQPFSGFYFFLRNFVSE